jgi:signal transduction histidine kinase/CHASE3 domain sensor protein/ActR/RegA family two-component response regulator
MKIRHKLILNNGAILGVMLLVSGGMYQGVVSLSESATWVSHTQDVITKARELTVFMVDMETGQRGFLLTGDESFLQPYRDGREGFDKTLDEARALVRDNPRQLIRLEQIERLQTEWVDAAAKPEIELRHRVDQGEVNFTVLANRLRGVTASGDPIPGRVKTGKQRMDAIRAALVQVVATERALMGVRSAKNKAAAADAKRASLLGALFAALLATAAGIYLVRTLGAQLGAEPAELRAVAEKVALGDLSERVSVYAGGIGIHSVATSVNQMLESFGHAAKSADAIAEGDYEVAVHVRGDDDLLGFALRRMTQTLREAASERERVRWVKAGQHELGAVTLGAPNVAALSKAVITQLATYLDASVGAFYSLSDGKFWLTGTYAFSHRKELTQAVGLGDGLVGQAALEGEPIVLSQVPADYVRISSGLGSGAPVCLALQPLLHEGKVLGVIELGALRAFEEHELDLLALVSPSVASAIHTANGRTRAVAALAETRAQANALKVQQESLEQANETLAEQASTLRISEELLLKSNDNLRAQGELLKEQADAVRRQKLELQAQKEELSQSNKYKSEFLSNMSHELRTPLNSMLILSKSLAENATGNMSDDQVEAAEVVHSGGAELLTLINEILDLPKIEAGRMDVVVEPVDLVHLLHGLKRQFRPLADEQGIDLVVGVGEGVQKVVQSDGQRIRQILKNLLSNAIKFTATGSVTLRVESVIEGRPAALAAADGVIAFQVTDTGIGIPEERRAAVFEAFQQVDGSTSRQYGGTGLGLTISRQLAGLLGGDLVLNRSDSSGSTFSFYLSVSAGDGGGPTEYARTGEPKRSTPVPEPTSPAPRLARAGATPSTAGPALAVPSAAAADEQIRKGKKVLLVDDDARNLFALSKLLTGAGMLVDCATNGKVAVEKAKANDDIAVVLMDIMMPIMDGLEATTLIRSMAGRFETLPIVALTANVMAGHKAECLAAGADSYLPKPVDTNELLRTIDGLLTAHGDSQRRTA